MKQGALIWIGISVSVKREVWTFRFGEVVLIALVSGRAAVRMVMR
jgi:hypothetical protein